MPITQIPGAGGGGAGAGDVTAIGTLQPFQLVLGAGGTSILTTQDLTYDSTTFRIAAPGGMLLPLRTTAERDAIISPVQGLEIYNTTVNEPEFFNGSVWLGIGTNVNMFNTSATVTQADRLITIPLGATLGFRFESSDSGDGFTTKSIQTNHIYAFELVVGNLFQGIQVAKANSGIRVFDDITTKGLVYDSDYSAQFTNRSLVDKEYVDNQISGGNVTAGSTLTANQMVLGNGTTDILTTPDVSYSGGTFVIDNSTGPASELALVGSGATVQHIVDNNYIIDHSRTTGDPLIEFRALPLDGTSGAFYRFGFASGSTGQQSIQLFEPNGASIQASIASSGGSTFFCGQGGNLGVGIFSAATKVHWHSTLADTTALVTEEVSGTNGAAVRTFVGTQNPEGIITANPGDEYKRANGTISGHFYFKGAVTGNIGWVETSTGGTGNVTAGSILTANQMVLGDGATEILTTPDVSYSGGTFLIDNSTGPASELEMVGNLGTLNQVVDNNYFVTLSRTIGVAFIEFRVLPLDGTSDAIYRFGINSGSTGEQSIQLFEPNGATLQAAIGTSGVDTTFCRQGGNLGVGQTNPGTKVHWRSTTNDDIPLVTEEVSGTNGAAVRTFVGTQNPEGAITANPGDTYKRANGTSSGHFYFKGASTGDTGWVETSSNSNIYTINGTINTFPVARVVTIDPGQGMGNVSGLEFRTVDNGSGQDNEAELLITPVGIELTLARGFDERFIKILDNLVGIIVRDDIDAKGLVYDGNYSAQFTNRSLVDKEYVDNQISGGNVTAGSTLTANQMVLGNGTTDILTTPDVSYSGGTFVIDNSTGPASELALVGSGATVQHIVDNNYIIDHSRTTGDSLMEFRALPLDGTSLAIYRFGQLSGSTGQQSIQLFEPNSSSQQAAIGTSGINTFFCGQGGNFGVGTVFPGTIVHWHSTAADTTPLVTEQVTGTNGAEVHTLVGTRNPEGIITGNPGDTYKRVNGVISGHFYYKGASTGTTGWVETADIRFVDFTGTAKTLALGDANTIHYCSNASPQQITIDGNIFKRGDTIVFLREGVGTVELIEGTSMTINIPATYSAEIIAQFRQMTIFFESATSCMVNGELVISQ